MEPAGALRFRERYLSHIGGPSLLFVRDVFTLNVCVSALCEV